MGEGRLIAFGSCYGCGDRFAYDPDTVTSVFVDPVTRRPPDVDENGRRQPIDREAAERAVRCPICPTCTALVVGRRRAGDTP